MRVAAQRREVESHRFVEVVSVPHLLDGEFLLQQIHRDDDVRLLYHSMRVSHRECLVSAQPLKIERFLAQQKFILQWEVATGNHRDRHPLRGIRPTRNLPAPISNFSVSAFGDGFRRFDSLQPTGSQLKMPARQETCIAVILAMLVEFVPALRYYANARHPPYPPPDATSKTARYPRVSPGLCLA